MTPVLITNAGGGVGHLRRDADPFVPAHVLLSLSEVPALILG